jgi:hypothetical protein
MARLRAAVEAGALAGFRPYPHMPPCSKTQEQE